MISVWEGKGMMYLTVSEVSKTYANETVATLALNNLSMQVEKGEFVAIVGHSGSGKTTLFNMVAGLDNADKGHIFFDGVDLTTLDEDARAAYRLNKIGIIYQFFNLLPMLNGWDNISLPCRLAGRFIDDKKIQQIASALGIKDKLNSLPSQMSGGEQQRIAVARALYNECELLLADEPTGNLDSAHSHELLELFKSLNDNDGVSILMVTHDSMIASYSQKLLYIKDGKIAETIERGDLSQKEYFYKIVDVNSVESQKLFVD